MDLRRTCSLPIGVEDKAHIARLWGIHNRLSYLGGCIGRYQTPALPPVEMSDESSEEISGTPTTYIVIKVSPDIQEKTLNWLVDKITGKRRDGGAELIVRKSPYDPSEGMTLHISASKIKFLEVAEEMELVKRDKYGQLREFIVTQLEDFLDDGMHVDDLLTMAERQTIVRHELENIRALAEDSHIPGEITCTLYEGQSVLQVLLQNGIIRKVFALHDREALKKLGRKWYWTLFRKQPLEEIREYFGEAVALYFNFIGFYTTALLVPMLLGFVQLFVSMETIPFFCAFYVVWATVFLETWRRRSNELAFTWGTIGMTSLDEPRANFHGHMGIDAVSGKQQPQYPRWKTNLKMYCVSFPIVLVCMAVGFAVMLISFWLEDYIRLHENVYSKTLIPIPSILYTGVVYFMNLHYRRLATFLTEWENHRTQSQYDRHRVTKLVLFEFVNNFMSLFYIAFIIQDFEVLRTQIAVMLIILQAINNFQEALLPLFTRFSTAKITAIKAFIRRKSSFHPGKESLHDQSFITPLPFIQELPRDDSQVEAAQLEGEMEDYEGTYDDYLEMFIQFGYVVLFSSVYPVAAFWAVLNNILEIRADAFKLCMAYQRPMSRRVKDIGAWQKAFEIVGALSILTNCGLLCLSPQIRRRAPATSSMEWILFFVFLEHILLGIRYVLHIAIPDKPEWVRVALARRNYESKQALKNERAQKSRRILTRKFRTVHGPHQPHLNDSTYSA